MAGVKVEGSVGALVAQGIVLGRHRQRSVLPVVMGMRRVRWLAIRDLSWRRMDHLQHGHRGGCAGVAWGGCRRQTLPMWKAGPS